MEYRTSMGLKIAGVALLGGVVGYFSKGYFDSSDYKVSGQVLTSKDNGKQYSIPKLIKSEEQIEQIKNIVSGKQKKKAPETLEEVFQ